MIKTFIIDDEPYCCETLVALLEEYCPEIKISGVFYNGRDALEAIKKIHLIWCFLTWKCRI
jgi:DNA-binding LytR/AlgR family response regulator